jgi:GNAT superfamily N-acetyltransferase
MTQQPQTIIDIVIGDWDTMKREVITLARQDDEPEWEFKQVCGMWGMFYDTIYPELYRQLEKEGADLNKLDEYVIKKREKYNKFGRVFIVAKYGDKIVGYCLWSFPLYNNGKCYLEYLMVDKDYRTRGIGEALMRTFFKWAEVNNRTDKKITFDGNNPDLVRFYSKLGFKREEGHISIHPKLSDWFCS